MKTQKTYLQEEENDEQSEEEESEESDEIIEIAPNMNLYNDNFTADLTQNRQDYSDEMRMLLDVDLNTIDREDLLGMLLSVKVLDSNRPNRNKAQSVHSGFNSVVQTMRNTKSRMLSNRIASCDPEYIKSNCYLTHDKVFIKTGQTGNTGNSNRDYEMDIKEILSRQGFQDNSNILQFLIPQQKERQIEPIGSKVNRILEHKRDKIERISRRLEMQTQVELTFKPNVLDKGKESRNLTQFISDQRKHLEKVSQENAKKREEFEKKKEEEFVGKPILYKSQIQLDFREGNIWERPNRHEKKEKSEEEFVGLIKKRLKRDPSSSKKADYEEVISVDVLGRRVSIEKKSYDRVFRPLKRSCDKKPQDEVIQIGERMHKQTQVKQEHIENLKARVIQEERGEGFHSIGSSNRYYLDRFVKFYKEKVTDLSKETRDSQIDKSEDLVEYPLALNQMQVLILLNKLGMVSNVTLNHFDEVVKYSIKKEPKREESEKQNPEDELKFSSITISETRLITKACAALKQSNTIRTNDLFIFCLCIIGVYEYYMLQSYKSSLSKEEIQELESVLNAKYVKSNGKALDSNELKKKLNEALLTKAIEKVESKASSSGRLVSRDLDNKPLITFSNSQTINKEFCLFYLNIYNQVTQEKKPSRYERDHQLNFEPKYRNFLSNSLYEKYFTKLMSDKDVNEFYLDKFKYRVDEDSKAEYFDKYQLKKQIYLDKLRKEIAERENAEFEKFSFKPSLALTSNFFLNRNKEPSLDQGVSRIEHLYKLGIDIVSSKRIELDEEEELDPDDKANCLFQPNLAMTKYLI